MRRALPASPEGVEDQLRKLSREIGRRRAQGQDVGDLVEAHRALREQAADKAPAEVAGGTTSGEIRTEVLHSVDEFSSLRPEWDELVMDAGIYSPFVTWEWLFPWWSSYGTRSSLRLLLVRSSTGRLLGIAPMMVANGPHGRCLCFLGTGSGTSRGDYFDFVLRRGFEAEARRALTTGLHGLAGEWDYVQLDHVRWSGETPTLLDALLEADGEVTAEVEGACVWGELPSTFNAFVEGVPHKRRRWDLRNQRSRLAEAHPSSCFKTCESAEAVQEGLVELARLSIERKQARGKVSSFSHTVNRRFRAEAAEFFRQKEWLRLDLLLVEGRPVGALMGFVFKQTYFCYQMGFEEDFAAVAPVHCLLARRVEELISQGVRGFDFLCGDHPYKREYFAGRQREVRLRFWPNSASGSKAALRAYGRRLWRQVRRKTRRFSARSSVLPAL